MSRQPRCVYDGALSRRLKVQIRELQRLQSPLRSPLTLAGVAELPLKLVVARNEVREWRASSPRRMRLRHEPVQ